MAEIFGFSFLLSAPVLLNIPSASSPPSLVTLSRPLVFHPFLSLLQSFLFSMRLSSSSSSLSPLFHSVNSILFCALLFFYFFATFFLLPFFPFLSFSSLSLSFRIFFFLLLPVLPYHFSSLSCPFFSRYLSFLTHPFLPLPFSSSPLLSLPILRSLCRVPLPIFLLIIFLFPYIPSSHLIPIPIFLFPFGFPYRSSSSLPLSLPIYFPSFLIFYSTYLSFSSVPLAFRIIIIPSTSLTYSLSFLTYSLFFSPCLSSSSFLLPLPILFLSTSLLLT